MLNYVYHIIQEISFFIGQRTFFTSLNSCSTWIHDILMKKVANVFLYITRTAHCPTSTIQGLIYLELFLGYINIHGKFIKTYYRSVNYVLTNQWVTRIWWPNCMINHFTSIDVFTRVIPPAGYSRLPLNLDWDFVQSYCTCTIVTGEIAFKFQFVSKSKTQ